MSELAEVLDSVQVFVRRFVVMSEEQLVAVALWTAHTHAFEASDYTPYLFVSSAERESGKSRLKEVCELVAANPIPTSNVSPAAMFRMAGEEPLPTFLVDEVDEIFAPKSERSELRGLLNAGFHRGDFAIRMVGEGAKQFPKRFSVYCPKLLAGKNSAALGDTLESRCIRIELKRKTRAEHIERFRRRELDEEASYLAETLRSLGGHFAPVLASARPELPEELSDRAQDVWEPLLAIADLAGEEYGRRARAAAVAIFTGRESDDSLGVRLLTDCHAIFNGYERLSTARLIELLCLLEESPWAEKWWNAYKGEPNPGAAKNLSWHLRRYGIHSKDIRFPDRESPLKGYERERFEDAWSRYLLPGRDFSRDIRDNPHEHSDSGVFTTRDTTPSVAGREGGASPHEHSDVAGVAAETTPEGAQGQFEDLGTASLEELWHRYERGEI